MVEGKIMNDEKVMEFYEDAISAVAMASENEREKDILSFRLGNLLKEQEVKVEFQFLCVLKVDVTILNGPIEFKMSSSSMLLPSGKV